MNPFELYGGCIAFSVFRKGKKIGSHKVSFKGEPENFTVKAECHLAVNLLFLQHINFNICQFRNGVRAFSIRWMFQQPLMALNPVSKHEGKIMNFQL